jgi:hypothetical protein
MSGCHHEKAFRPTRDLLRFVSSLTRIYETECLVVWESRFVSELWFVSGHGFSRAVNATIHSGFSPGSLFAGAEALTITRLFRHD